MPDSKANDYCDDKCELTELKHKNMPRLKWYQRYRCKRTQREIILVIKISNWMHKKVEFERLFFIFAL